MTPHLEPEQTTESRHLRITAYVVILLCWGYFGAGILRWAVGR